MPNIPIIKLYTSDPTIPGSNPTGYVITEHNRQPLQINYERIEQSSRMADGTMRRFITANKKNITLNWDDLPSAAGYPFTSDSNLAGAFLKSFYEENVYNPLWIKLTYSEESWRFQNINAASSISSTNPTFNTTNSNNLSGVPNSFAVASVKFSAFSSGSATASVITSVPTTFSSNTITPELYLSGINQIFNGTWMADSYSSSVAVFRFGVNNNSSATFKINSYVQSGNSASFNVDNTSYIQNGASIVINNSKYVSGSSINATWVVTASPTSQTIFTASTVSSQIGSGVYGDATILSSPSVTLSLGNYPAVVGPAISSDVIKVFITDFNYEIKKRYQFTDIVNVGIKFTEI